MTRMSWDRALELAEADAHFDRQSCLTESGRELARQRQAALSGIRTYLADARVQSENIVQFIEDHPADVDEPMFPRHLTADVPRRREGSDAEGGMSTAPERSGWGIVILAIFGAVFWALVVFAVTHA